MKSLLSAVFVALAATCILSVCRAWGQPPRAVRRRARPVAFADLQIDPGELQARLTRNFNRLEEEKYQPHKVFLTAKQDAGWPGDTEGRTVLGLVLDAQATHREPKFLAEILRRFPEKMNAKGYFGPVYLPAVASEQQLSSHGWVLRGLAEYYLWKKEERILRQLNTLLDNLVLPTRGLYRAYPIDPAHRQHAGSYAGNSLGRIGRWDVSSDIGCAFVFLDGVVQACQVTGRKDIQPIIEEMIHRFLDVDLLAIRAQTHSSLTGMRGLLRYYEVTGDAALLEAVRQRFDLYKQHAMTENYENYNWFGRPEWTEPCAVIDSFLVAVGLWRLTGNPVYLEDAQHIYYNGMAFEQVANGGFACNSCSGAGSPWLAVKVDESHWCCTHARRRRPLAGRPVPVLYPARQRAAPRFPQRRGADPHGQRRARAAGRNRLSFPGQGPLDRHRKHVAVAPRDQAFRPPLDIPSDRRLNGRPVKAERTDGFLAVAEDIKRGDVIEYAFHLESGSMVAENVHSIRGYHKFYYGPLLLACRAAEERRLAPDVGLTRQAGNSFKAAAADVTLTTVYHLMDSAVKTKPPYKLQVLFAAPH